MSGSGAHLRCPWRWSCCGKSPQEPGWRRTCVLPTARLRPRRSPSGSAVRHTQASLHHSGGEVIHTSRGSAGCVQWRRAPTVQRGAACLQDGRWLCRRALHPCVDATQGQVVTVNTADWLQSTPGFQRGRQTFHTVFFPLSSWPVLKSFTNQSTDCSSENSCYALCTTSVQVRTATNTYLCCRLICSFFFVQQKYLESDSNNRIRQDGDIIVVALIPAAWCSVFPGVTSSWMVIERRQSLSDFIRNVGYI